ARPRCLLLPKTLSRSAAMNSLEDWFRSAGFMPHGFCYQWKPGLIWLHASSDFLIALAYFSIPIALIQFVRKRKDLPFSWMFVCFGVFIAACGLTHLMDVWTLWIPWYWISGGVKVITALASLPTAFFLVQLMPKLISPPVMNSCAPPTPNCFGNERF